MASAQTYVWVVFHAGLIGMGPYQGLLCLQVAISKTFQSHYIALRQNIAAHGTGCPLFPRAGCVRGDRLTWTLKSAGRFVWLSENISNIFQPFFSGRMPMQQNGKTQYITTDFFRAKYDYLVPFPALCDNGAEDRSWVELQSPFFFLPLDNGRLQNVATIRIEVSSDDRTVNTNAKRGQAKGGIDKVARWRTWGEGMAAPVTEWFFRLQYSKERCSTSSKKGPR